MSEAGVPTMNSEGHRNNDSGTNSNDCKVNLLQPAPILEVDDPSE